MRKFGREPLIHLNPRLRRMLGQTGPRDPLRHAVSRAGGRRAKYGGRQGNLIRLPGGELAFQPLSEEALEGLVEQLDPDLVTHEELAAVLQHLRYTGVGSTSVRYQDKVFQQPEEERGLQPMMTGSQAVGAGASATLSLTASEPIVISHLYMQEDADGIVSTDLTLGRLMAGSTPIDKGSTPSGSLVPYTNVGDRGILGAYIGEVYLDEGVSLNVPITSAAVGATVYAVAGNYMHLM